MAHRVLIVHNEYLQSGGEDAAVSGEAALLRGAGVETDLALTSNRDLRLGRSISRWRTAFACTWSELHYKSLRSKIRQFQPTIVHCHNLFPVPSPAAYYACRVEGVPVVQTLHNYRMMCLKATFFRNGQPCFDCLNRTPVPGVRHRCYRGSVLGSAASAVKIVVHRAVRTWTRAVDRYIALTPASRGIFIRGGLPAELIEVKPNFIDPDPGHGEHGGRFALFVGRLTAEKGIGTLLDAWTLSPGGGHLHIIGGGPLADLVRERVAHDPRITYLGELPRSQVLEHMKQARILILPSLWNEGLPFVALEAMAVGLPILCSNVENLEDVVVRDGAGWSFRIGSAGGLAQALRAVWDDDPGLSERGNTGRDVYLSKYTAAANLRVLLRLYDCIVRKAAGKSVAAPR